MAGLVCALVAGFLLMVKEAGTCKQVWVLVCLEEGRVVLAVLRDLRTSTLRSSNSPGRAE